MRSCPSLPHTVTFGFSLRSPEVGTALGSRARLFVQRGLGPRGEISRVVSVDHGLMVDGTNTLQTRYVPVRSKGNDKKPPQM